MTTKTKVLIGIGAVVLATAAFFGYKKVGGKSANVEATPEPEVKPETESTTEG
jgi:hypothetical protein